MSLKEVMLPSGLPFSEPVVQDEFVGVSIKTMEFLIWIGLPDQVWSPCPKARIPWDLQASEVHQS